MTKPAPSTSNQKQKESLRPYTPPAIVHEGKLLLVTGGTPTPDDAPLGLPGIGGRSD